MLEMCEEPAKTDKAIALNFECNFIYKNEKLEMPCVGSIYVTGQVTASSWIQPLCKSFYMSCEMSES